MDRLAAPWTAALAAMATAGCRIGFGPIDHGAGQLDAASPDAPRFSLDAGQCPPGYALAGSRCYRVVATGSGWLVGEHACEADAVGAHLIVIDDNTERAMLVPGLGLGARTWIGTSKLTNASYLTATNLAPYLDLGVQTEPSEDCLSLHADGLMYLHTCTDANPYVCEYDAIAAVPSAY